LASHRLECIEARIHHHQGNAERGERQQARAEQRSFGEERFDWRVLTTASIKLNATSRKQVSTAFGLSLGAFQRGE